MRRLLVAMFAVLPAVAAAQQPRVELVPTVGYLWGGEIVVRERAIRHRDFDVGLSSSGSYGVKLDVPVGRRWAVEFLALRQETQLEDDQGLFGEVPGGFIEPGSTHVLDAEATYLHAGLMWIVREGPARWHLVATVGATHFNFVLPLPSDTQMSVSAGGGVQMEMSPRLAVRFEARAYWTRTDDGLSATYTFANPDCTGDCSYTYVYKSSMLQTELSAGLVFRF